MSIMNKFLDAMKLNEDDEYDYYRIDFKDSEVKIFFNNEL